MTTNKHMNEIAGEVSEGLNFILSHFSDDDKEPTTTSTIWPRTISTKTTEGRQFLVYNTAQALARFRKTNYLQNKCLS
jgi:hypothetical protein